MSMTLDWKVIDQIKLKKEFKFDNFKQAMDFVNKVAQVAEAQQHHPNITIDYNKVILELWTHSIGGISEKDYAMAEKINQLHHEG